MEKNPNSLLFWASSLAGLGFAHLGSGFYKHDPKPDPVLE